MSFSTQANQTINGSVAQGAEAAATAPWSVRLSDGAAFYTGAKTGQLPTTLGQATKAASLSVTIASDQTVPIDQPSATYSVISTSGTTTVASSARTLYKIFWAAGVGSTMAAYDDGSGGTTNQFVSKLTSSDGEIDFGPLGVRLANGLTVVTTGGTPAFITFILRT